MSKIDIEKYLQKSGEVKFDEVKQDVKRLAEEFKMFIESKDDQYVSTWLLETDIFLQAEKGVLAAEKETLSRGRIIHVNPGVTNIGREQRYVHPYIVLGEYKETFIGVPVTNKAFNNQTKEYYLRHFFEVELKDPDTEKPYTEYRCYKPSVADIRNISGLDKRRIIKDSLYYTPRYVPFTYLNAISQKIRESLAVIR